MKAFHTKDLALVKHAAIVSDYTVAALNPEEPGNPTMDNLTTILNVLRKVLQVNIKVQTIACA